MILDILPDVFDQIPAEQWSSMKDRTDPFLENSGLISAIIWVDNILREWCGGMTPADACREILARSPIGEAAVEVLAPG